MKIVAPAGNMERFKAAINGGAREIYMGLKGFGARRNAENFTVDEFITALDYAHLRGARIFLTLNTIMAEKEMDFLYINLKKLYEHGLDAVIVQDLGYFRYMKENFPNMEYHGSTQMTVGNHVECNYLKSIGFTRVVLPREMTFEEIKKIRENTDIELEIFVSGALCISYSGNCYLSSFIGSRSGNRGMCAQPCRKCYSSNGENGYFLSPKDQLYSAGEINKLKDIGIESIKIEGRMKDPKYVFQTVNYYKNLIDGNREKERTSDIFNRGYSKGYFYGNDETLINKNYSSSLGKNLGVLMGRKLKLMDSVVLGDGVTYLSSTFEKLGGGYINKIELENGDKSRKKANPRDVIILRGVPRGTKYIYKSYAKETYDEVERNLKDASLSLGITGKFIGKIGEEPRLIFDANGIQAEVRDEKLVEKASKRALDREGVFEKISKLGDTTFELEKLDVEIDEDIFVPVSVLNNLKRECAEILEGKILESFKRKAPKKFELPKEYEEKRNVILSAIVSNKEQEKAVREYGIERIYHRGLDIAREGNLEAQDLNSKLASNLYQLLENKNDDVVVNWNLNITNRYTIKELEKIGKVETVILSPEISFDAIKEIGKTDSRKAILGYSKLKGMFIEIPIFDEKERIIENEQGDKFILTQNEYGNTELHLDRALNILNDLYRMKDLYIDEVVIEFSIESKDECKKVLEDIKKRAGIYRAFNYERGVY